MKTSSRLEGLDVARFIALIGMVIVNFDMVMTGGNIAETGFSMAALLQGRAAATFVVLAGVGLGLAAQRKAWNITLTTTVKRALFLFVVGLLNALIFEPDIIHYYAVYFFLALFFLRAPNWALWVAIAGLIIDFVGMVIFLDYDKGWNWTTYAYSDFWTVSGFLRNLFFNGWHPVIPWFAFILFGIWLSRLDLRAPHIKRRLVMYGGVTLVCVTLISTLFMRLLAQTEPDAAILFTTAPVPPMPLYMLAGGSFSAVLIGVCLYLEDPLRRWKVLPALTVPGRQTLTLYIAHIILGMGTLEVLGLIGGQSANHALLASALFCLSAVIFSLIWSKFSPRGPMESLMRRLT